MSLHSEQEEGETRGRDELTMDEIREAVAEGVKRERNYYEPPMGLLPVDFEVKHLRKAWEIEHELTHKQQVLIREYAALVESDTKRLGDMWLLATAALFFGVLWGVMMTSQYLEGVMRGAQ